MQRLGGTLYTYEVKLAFRSYFFLAGYFISPLLPNFGRHVKRREHEKPSTLSPALVLLCTGTHYLHLTSLHLQLSGNLSTFFNSYS